jgi:protoporphyrinogen IX oxidase
MGYFWLKVFHIAAMTVWFTGLFFLPRLFVAMARGARATDVEHLKETGKTLYFRIVTPAGLLTIGFGLALIGFGFDGVWLPFKLVLVSLLAALHLYNGLMLLDLIHGRSRHGVTFYRVLNGLPLVLLLCIAALTAAKPATLLGFG